jgi:DNA-binding NtrC family response regulator
MAIESRPEPSEQVVVCSERMTRLYALARRAASARLPALILGETGTGKELVAHVLHSAGPRADGPFVALNCGALPATLAESVLFGHERGAFTGADRTTQGAFQQASSGTLLLDEVGELSLSAQASLLRVLETGCVTPIGGRERRVDVRVVAATHRDLEAMVERGSFRRDLLHRVNAITLEVPPLRERREEIEPLCRHFLALSSERTGSRVERITPAAMAKLYTHGWPGNVRELRNLIESRAALGSGPLLDVEDLPSSFGPHPEPIAKPGMKLPPASDIRAQLRAYELALLLDGLRRAGGNQCRAAELLAMPRRTLCRRIKELGIGREYMAREVGGTVNDNARWAS